MGRTGITLAIALLVLLAIPYRMASAHMGAKFEPADGQVIHGLGQYVPIFYTDAERWQYVSNYQTAVGHVPVIYAAYKFLNPAVAPLDTTNLTDIVLNHGHPYHLNLGLALFDASQKIDANAIIEGDWDVQITGVALELKTLGVPCFVRPGFEFGAADGIHHDITGPQFIAVWNHIRAVFSNTGTNNVAWVWNAVNPNTFNYMSYYPGDAAVDWWGINYFTVSQMTNSDGFVQAAATHGKPVMVCESCPIENGGTTNAANWQNWFVPYFNRIASHPHLKAFTFISDPWDRSGYFDWWPSSLIDAGTPATIRNGYAAEMANTKYLHHGTLQALTLTEVNDPWGTISMVPDPIDANDPSHLRFLPGTWATLQATPIDGKSFRQWEVYNPNYPGDANYAVIDANTTLTLVMDGNRQVAAVFKCGGGAGQALPLLGMALVGLAVVMRFARTLARSGRSPRWTETD